MKIYKVRRRSDGALYTKSVGRGAFSTRSKGQSYATLRGAFDACSSFASNPKGVEVLEFSESGVKTISGPKLFAMFAAKAPQNIDKTYNYKGYVIRHKVIRRARVRNIEGDAVRPDLFNYKQDWWFVENTEGKVLRRKNVWGGRFINTTDQICHFSLMKFAKAVIDSDFRPSREGETYYFGERIN